METTQLKQPPKVTAKTCAGEINSEFLHALREGYRMSPTDLACHNAVSNNPAKPLALNRGLARGDDGQFSHRVRSKGITNQKKSGRCWMFAGVEDLRADKNNPPWTNFDKRILFRTHDVASPVNCMKVANGRYRFLVVP